MTTWENDEELLSDSLVQLLINWVVEFHEALPSYPEKWQAYDKHQQRKREKQLQPQRNQQPSPTQPQQQQQEETNIALSSKEQALISAISKNITKSPTVETVDYHTATFYVNCLPQTARTIKILKFILDIILTI